ncbi:MAG: retroviral-like aspartic protease family protein [Clostridiales bacterium]|jgi:predicted aspartyl protease|nr:retroviral-like aspartic protease family protein [Clostridiales bacterium]
MSRVHFKCTIGGRTQRILFDPGASNTVITLKLAGELGLKSRASQLSKIYLAGDVIDVVPVVLPDLTMGTLRLANVRVYAGLGKNWNNTVILGLNVLNHLIYTVDRSQGGGFITLGTNGEPPPNTFNRLISNDGKYYISGGEYNERI